MTHPEFARVMATLEAGSGKPASKETHEVYWQLLGDLPEPALRAAAARALLESRYPVFPPVGTLRQLAAEALRGPDAAPDGALAWEQVRRAIASFGARRPDAAFASLAPAVRRAAECMGWREMCDSTEAGVLRAQFLRVYETCAERERREALLPPSVRQTLARVAGAFPRLADRSA